MLRSLHMKLSLILLLLIISLMSVVGSFLISSVVRFYMDEFSQQMASAFTNTDFITDLSQAAIEDDPVMPVRMSGVVEAYAALLGVNGSQRKFYILDGYTGVFLIGSPAARSSSYTPTKVPLTLNILTAIEGEPGYSLNMANSFFDCAIPISAGEKRYIIYINDSKESLNRLTADLFTIIIEAVLFGLVISIFLSLLLSKTITNPIERLTQSAIKVSNGDFSDPLEVYSSDEIGILTRTFNHMAGVLKNTLETVVSERDKLGTLFIYMTDGVAAFDRHGEMLHVNPAAAQYLSLTTTAYKDMLGHIIPIEELLELKPPKFLERSTVAQGKHLQIFFAPFGTETETGGIMAIIHDNTEQFRLDEIRREFVANVSHELRTPLTNVKSYAETLADSAMLSEETIRNFAGVIVNETDRMTRLVKDLLTLSKFDYGKMDWTVKKFSIEETVKNIYEVMLIEARRHNHTCTLEIQQPLSDIWGDRERIEQVLINILSNAFSYTPDNGIIELRAGNAKEARVWISVKDNGIGIPAEDLPRIFERFYRVDKARSRSMGGTGLGLAIAYDIIRAHQGNIEIQSEAGKGTLMTIFLPINEKPEALRDEGII